MKPASKVAMCGLSTALSVLILFLGGIIPILAYVCPMITGIIMIMLVTTFGYASSWITYIATSFLSIFIVPDKECAMMYILFFGYFTIMRIYINRVKIKFLNFLIKFLIFNIAFALDNVILFYVFGIPIDSDGLGMWFVIAFWIGMNFVFLVYEHLINVLDLLYKYKIEKRIKHILK